MEALQSAIKDQLLEDISAIKSASALRAWGLRWALDIGRLPEEMKTELRKEYETRMGQLNGGGEA
jgi:hypothetical protein